MHFNPTDLQTTGVGIAAFLATVLMVFVFLSARRERLGLSMWLMLVACSTWAWFGFLYQIVPGIELAREMRVISVMGIVWISISEMNFVTVYLSERVPISRIINMVRWLVFAGGAILTALLFADLWGTHLIVGALSSSPDTVLAPDAGPLMIVLVGYYILVTAISGVLLALRARAGVDESDRRQALILFVCMTVGLALGGTRFTPWYGFDFYPLVGDIGFPLFTFGALYSIQRYRLLNVQVAAAQILVFVLWTSTFFRVLLDKSIPAATPDIALFVTVLILGIFLLRSVVAEIRTQKELAKLTIDRAKSEFVTIAAHQLRTPLSALRWSLQLLLTNSTPLSDEQRDIAQKGSRAADNMMELVNDLLNVSRINEGKFGFTIVAGDLRDVARAAVTALEEAAQLKHINVSLDMPKSSVAANFDPGKLALALGNLIDNAIKYTPEGGSVRVAVLPGKDTISISVSDAGIGISVEDQARLFEKFFRGKDAVRMSTDGSGLGLSIVKTIVDGHSGKIAVTSQKGHGTTVVITLPTPRPPRA